MASVFKSDVQGFLIGEVIENGRDLMRAQQQGIAIWKAIRTDLRAVRTAINAQISTVVRTGRPGAAPRAPSTSRAAGGNWRITPSAVVPAGRSAPVLRSAVARGAVVVAQPRGASGRFVAGQRPASGGASGGGVLSSSALGRMNDSLGKLASSLQAADNIDPTVNAMKEVKDVVSPLGRGLFSLFGRTSERKREVWYRRFLKALTPGSQKAQQVVGGGLFGGGGGGGLGGLLGAAGGSAAGGLLGKGKGLLKGGGKLLKRIPVLGALISGGMALGSAFGMDDDPSKSPEENRTQRYRDTGEAVGMGVGGAAGAAVGSLLGPIGTVVGGYLGAMLGEKIGGAVGEWTKSFVDSDVGGKVIQGWDVFTTGLGAAWDSLVTDAKTTWGDITTKAGAWWDSTKEAAGTLADKVSSLADGMNSWFKDKTGIDVKQNVTAAADKVGEVAGNAWEKTKGVAIAGWSAAKGYGADALDAAKTGAAALVPNTAKRAYSAGAAAAGQAKAGYDVARGTESTAGAPVGALQQGARAAGGSLGDLIAKGEGGYGSFNRGQAGDSRGASMDFSNMTIDQIMAAQSLPKGDKDRLFAVGKYQVIPSTLKGAVGSMGLKGDEKFTPELQERIFGEYLADKKRPEIASYIRGGGDLASAQKAGAKEWASIADPSTGKSFYAGSGNNKAHLSAEAFGGALGTARAQYQRLVATGMDSKAAYQAAVVASPTIPSPVPANIPSAVPATIPKPTEVKDVATPLNSAGAGRGSLSVSIPDTIGQNVSDRGTAHVVTGGLGGAV